MWLYLLFCPMTWPAQLHLRRWRTYKLSQVQRLIFMLLCWLLVLAMLAGLYLSKTISLPLQQMNQAAMEVIKAIPAAGKVTSSDEVGWLAQTFNHMALNYGRPRFHRKKRNWKTLFLYE